MSHVRTHANWSTANGTASTFFNVGAVDCKLTPIYKSPTLSRVYYTVSAFHSVFCISRIFMFHIFHPCIIVSHFPVSYFQRPP